MNSSSPPFFSVITVTYNAEKYLEATFDSIVEQDFDRFELIVVDGQSADGTPAIIERYRSRIDVLVVERDQGIYDAMNKGVGQASGQYINFMNASDRFYSPQVLSQVYHAITDESEVDIAYGKVINISSEQSGYQYESGKPLSKRAFFSSMPMCHQTMFTRRTLFEEIGAYPVERGAGALYDWIGAYYAIRRNFDRILFIPRRIAYYLVGGYSFRMMKTISRERLATARRYFSLKYQLYNYVSYGTMQIKAELLMLMARYDLLDRYRQTKYKLLRRSV